MLHAPLAPLTAVIDGSGSLQRSADVSEASALLPWNGWATSVDEVGGQDVGGAHAGQQQVEVRDTS